MSKKTNIIIATAVMGLSTHAATKSDYWRISAEYSRSYFDYLDFKQNAPSQIATVKASIAKTRPAFKAVESEYNKEAALYNRLNNEYVAIPGKITSLQNKKQNSIDAIPALKQAAKVKGLFSPSENPNQELSQKKINDLRQVIVAKEAQVSTLEAKIDEIENRPEWQKLSFERSTTLSELETKKNRRLNRESAISRLSSRINTLEREIRNLQTTIFKLEDRRDFIDMHLPELSSQASQVSSELNNKNNEVFATEESLSDVNQRIRSMERERSNMSSELTDKQNKLSAANAELKRINGILNGVPALRAELSQLQTEINNAQQRLSNKESKKAKKEKRISNKRTQLENTRSEVSSLNAQISQLESNQGNTPAEIARLESLIQEKQQLANTLPDLRKQKRQLEKEIQALENSSTSGPTPAEIKVLELATKIVNKEASKVELAEFMKEAIALYGRLDRNPRKFAKKIVNGNVPQIGGGDSSSAELTAKQNQLNDLVNNQIPAARSAKKEIPGLESQLQSLQSGNTSTQDQLRDLRSQRDAAQAKIAPLESEINTLQGDINTLTGEISDVKARMAKKTKKVTNIQDQLVSLPDLDRKKKRLENRRIPNLSSDIRQLERDLSRNNGALSRLTSSRDILTGELRVLKRQRDRLDSELRSLNSQMSSLGRELQDIANQTESLNSQMSLSESELRRKRSDLFSAESELTRLNAEIPGLQAKYNSAQSSYDTYYANNQAPHQKNINQLNSEVRSHNGDIRQYNKLIENLDENEQIIVDSTNEIASLETRQTELEPQVEAQGDVYEEVRGRFQAAESAYDRDLTKLNRLKRDWDSLSNEIKTLESRNINTYKNLKR